MLNEWLLHNLEILGSEYHLDKIVTKLVKTRKKPIFGSLPESTFELLEH